MLDLLTSALIRIAPRGSRFCRIAPSKHVFASNRWVWLTTGPAGPIPYSTNTRPVHGPCGDRRSSRTSDASPNVTKAYAVMDTADASSTRLRVLDDYAFFAINPKLSAHCLDITSPTEP